MNYNANVGPKQPFGRKIKRVTDVNSMGFNPYEQQQQQGNPYSNVGAEIPSTNTYQTGYGAQPVYSNSEFGVPSNGPAPGGLNYNQQTATPYPNVNPTVAAPQHFGVLGQPVVQDMALQYGQQLAGAGKTMIKKEVEKYVPVTKLKYYFAVDRKYVTSKLLLLFFPFAHKDWSIKYEQDGPVQPRFEINAPDLYIPTMAYITYVLIAGLALGTQQRFTPEQIGITASSALAWCIVELAVYSCILYILQVNTSLKTLDLLAYSGYKYIGIILSISSTLLGGKTAYYSCLLYTSLALVFFLMRNLKTHVLISGPGTASDQGYYGQEQTIGHKRRLYFLLFIAVLQPIMSWWLSYHLLPSDVSPKPT